MRVVLHPGLPKSGSTTIQVALREAAPNLAGLDVYVVEPERTLRHQSLMDDVVARLDVLVQEHGSRRSSTAVVSHESLVDCGRAVVVRGLTQMRDLGLDVSVVLVTRPLGDWVASSRKYLLRNLVPSRDSGLLPLADWLDTWTCDPVRDVAGELALVDLRDPRGLLRAFAETVDLPPGPLLARAGSLVANPGLSDHDLAVAFYVADALSSVIEGGFGALLDAGDYRALRKFLVYLLSSGQHHQHPETLVMGQNWRDRFMRHFISDIDTLLLSRLGEADPTMSAAVHTSFKRAMALVREDDKGTRFEVRAMERVAREVAVSLALTQQAFVEWCSASGRTDFLEAFDVRIA